MQAIFETLFDVVYLATVITLGVKMILGSGRCRQYRLFGAMAVTLGCGDAFCSGFISAYKRGFSLEGCGLIGSAASAKICAVVGCNAGMRPFDELIAHARDFGYDAK